MTDEQIEAMASGLTKAQKRALCPNESGWASDHKGKGLAKTILTAAKLFNLGLFAESQTLSPLTPIGIRVRDWLLKNKDDV